MAKYQPYQTRRQISRRHMRTTALILVVIIVGVVILIKTVNRNAVVQSEPQRQTTSLENILPDGGASKPPVEQRVAPVAADAIELAPVASVSKTTKPEAAATDAAAANTGSPSIQTTPVTQTPAAPAATPTPAVPAASSTIPADNSGVTSPEAQTLIEKAMQLAESGKIIATRDLLNHTLDLQLSLQVRSAVKNKLAKLADDWLFSRDVYESDKLTSYYLVQSGDLLASIAKRYKVPYESLMRINKVSRPELLQAGQKIKVIDGPFNVVVYKGSFTMDLYLQNVYVKTYRVGLGTINRETPAGRWRVKKGGKLISPRWTDDETGKVYVGSDPDYPLGSRWIAIEGLDENTKNRTGFAIHGTKDPETIGTRSSRGCIRLFNGDAIEVYNLLVEGISEVLVVE